MQLVLRLDIYNKPMRYIFLITIFSVFLSGMQGVLAQSNTLPVSKEYNLRFESYLMNQADTFHSCILPYIEKNVVNYENVNKEMFVESDSKPATYLLNKHPLVLFSDKVFIRPLVNIEQGGSFKKTIPFYQSLGLNVLTRINPKLSVDFSVYGTHQRFGLFEQSLTDSTRYLSETGSRYTQSGNRYAFWDWQGAIAYQAGPYFHFQVGRGKNFWGDGYRSLLLSDNSAPYPFVKISATAGKLQYIVLYQFLKDVDTNIPGYPEENKYATSHFLSWNIGKRININLFETVVWRNKMDNGGKRGFDFNYINPIIFFRPLEFETGSADNMLLGAGFRLRVFSNTHLYGQLILDEFKLDELRAQSGWWANKYGYQLGFKIYDAFKVKNLFVRAEYNMVRPFTYSHRSSAKNYGHLFRPLAHPLGANFKEYLSVINYRFKRWQFQATAIFSKLGTDADTLNMGQNIYRSYSDSKMNYGNSVLQGNLNQLLQMEFKTSYIINPLWNLRAELGFRFFRWNVSSVNRDEKYIFVGLKTTF